MRLLLLLHPSYCFPHPLESFPADRYFYQWLDQHKENKLVIVGRGRLQFPEKYAQRISYYSVSYNHTDSFFSLFMYQWNVMRQLKKNKADCILFDGLNTFRFISENRWLSFMFHRILRKKYSILMHEESRPPVSSFKGHIIQVPECSSPVFDNVNEKEHENIKEKITQGVEYFLCSASFTSPEQLTVLLKAYSIFKQRLKTSFKLVLSGLQPHDNRFYKLLNSYKYRHDIVIPDQADVMSFSSLLAEAYAHIFPATDAFCPYSYADCGVSRVPFIFSEREKKEREVLVGLSFKEGDVQELAQQMMQIYKDEAGRKQIIQNMYEYYRQHNQSFEFSSTLPVAHC